MLWAPPPPPPPVPGPQPPRRGLHVKQPPLFSAAAGPAVLPARSCHGPGMQTSGWEQKAPLGPSGGEPSSLAPRGPLARRSLEVLGWRKALLPFPAPPRPGSPPGRRGARRGQLGEEGRGGAATGSCPSGREGAAEAIGSRGTEGGASARLRAREPSAGRSAHRPTPTAPRRAGGRAPPPERARGRGATPA